MIRKKTSCFLPAEWHPQSVVQITWPHLQSDWGYMLEEVTACFVRIAEEISKRQKLLIVCHDASYTSSLIRAGDLNNITLVEINSNDTWARDHGAISIIENENPVLLDFGFNGWGNKFEAGLDNAITKQLFDRKIFKKNICYQDLNHFILEGGAIESDGKGTLMTTRQCLFSSGRNDTLNEHQIEEFLKTTFNLDRVLWLNHGYLAGDDTDSHIDTLARFCNEHTIAYIGCDDTTDEHFLELHLMEKELQSFTTSDHLPYNLVRLPMADPVYDQDYNRLPATYANFLIMNTAVLLPFYNSSKDRIVAGILQEVFPDKEVIGINCLPLVQQHGSLHCVTMQYPEGVI